MSEINLLNCPIQHSELLRVVNNYHMGCVILQPSQVYSGTLMPCLDSGGRTHRGVVSEVDCTALPCTGWSQRAAGQCRSMPRSSLAGWLSVRPSVGLVRDIYAAPPSLQALKAES